VEAGESIMSGGVDNRVVSLTFDNSQFQRKMEETLKSLDKLRASLDVSNGKKSMEELSAASGKFNVDHISQGIQGVSKSFLALSTIAITVLSGIASKAVDVGARLVKSFALDGIIAGFQEFELKMGAIQTIMAGSGESLDVVNTKLQELNEYSDKTIYSFKDMTTNIGKFTNAGLSLDQSVASIKGVANVAAVSGANAEEASRAMYNFAQALSKGHVALIDWKSIELANMGTAEFKQQLIDAADASGKLTKRGNEWVTSAGHAVTATKGFNESLTDEWLTTEVLNKTLGNYSDATTDIGKKATAAAQDVKTFTMLIDTVKESIGSGWAQSFENVIGNFEESKQLWTGVNAAISTFVSKSADSRNELLKGWKDAGGRAILIEGLKDAFIGLASVVKPITAAFREIFPPATVDTLMKLTHNFANWAKTLKLTAEQSANLKATFKGLFAILSIGWTVIKGVASIFKELFSQLMHIYKGIGGVTSQWGHFFIVLQRSLVTGGGIADFFQKITDQISKLGPWIDRVKEKIGSLFGDGIPGADVAVSIFDRIKERMDQLSTGAQKVVGLFKALGQEIKSALEKVWPLIQQGFDELKQRLKDVLMPSDMSGVLDAVNVGLLGGLVILLKKFMKNGLKLDFGGGIMEKVAGTLDALTSKLQTMQQQIKVDMLLKIAIALAVLAASILVLSLIDPGDLTKAMTALAVGFGELVAAFAALDKISSNMGSAKLAILAAGLILVAGAMLILSFAVKNLAGLSMTELATGLGGVAGMLFIMVKAIEPLTKDVSGMIKAGVGMAAIGVGLLILSLAVRSFASIDIGSMVYGLTAIGVTLLGFVGIMKLVPETEMIAFGIALIGVAVGLNILASAVSKFGSIDAGTMVQGLLGIGVALLGIAGIMYLFPSNMVLTAAGLLLVAIALNGIAAAVGTMGNMDIEAMTNGIKGLAIMLGLLVVSVNLMNDALMGAAAMVIVAAALWVLAEVLEKIGGMSWGDLIKGLVGLAAVLAIIGIAALAMEPIVGAIVALGVALIFVGAGIALFGIGAFFLAKAFEAMAKAGVAGTKALIDSLKILAAAIPDILGAFIKSLVDSVKSLLELVPVLITILTAVLEAMLEMIITLAPKIAEALVALVLAGLDAIRTIFPQMVQTGIDLIMALLTGIRDNVGEMVTVVGEIITSFIDNFSTQLHNIVTSIKDLIVTFFNDVAFAVGEVAGTILVGVGLQFMDGFLQGVTGGESGPMNFFTELPGKVLGWLGDVLGTLWDKGSQLLEGLWNGIQSFVGTISDFYISLGSTILGWIGDVLGTLVSKGTDLIQGLWNGITGKWSEVESWITGIGGKILSAIGDIADVLVDIGEQIIGGLLEGLKKGWETASGWLGDVGGFIVDLKGPPKKDAILLVNNGMLIMQGLHKGMESEWAAVEEWLGNLSPAEALDKNIGATMGKALAGVANQMTTELEGMAEFSPTITPVLDLTGVQKDARLLGSMLATTSFDQAKLISHTTDVASTEAQPAAPTAPTEVKFEQNIYAPTALSTNDIYRNTRSQIVLAKEELNIP
jgi:hypothetical protein